MDAAELIEGYAMYVSPEEADSLQIPDLDVEGQSFVPTPVATTLIVHC
ncbi:hypothetical protein ACH4MW_09465 [Streptomyces luteogriseus]|nr:MULTISPECIES: hypothetical protein [unclassified Streptomyces]MCX3288423.1 hypothetical protein [Streptomyces sp. NEAU-H22]WMD08366.1 hypothetical protein Q7C01_30075 [Streptomyces sp. FXY-T5]